jgi:hypothetical protein
MTDELTPAEEARLTAALHAIAAETPPAAPLASSRRPVRIAVGVAAAAVVAAGLIVASSQLGDAPARQTAQRPSPTATPSGPGTQLGLQVVTYDLARLAREADQVVIGRVTEIRRGAGEDAGGLPYVLAHVAVQDVLKGGGGDLWAFDYELGAGTSSVAGGPPWELGDRLLLFLASPAGTVHQGVQPAHLQVVGGAQGRYAFRGDALDAPFTLAEVRAAVARAS